MCTDLYGNLYVAGIFSGQVDFDPSTNVFNLSAAGSGGGVIQSSFIWKLSKTGQFLGAASFGGGFPILRYDGQQNLYCSGRFKGSADIDPGQGVTSVTLNAQMWNAYIVKLDFNLNLTSYGLFRSFNISEIQDFEFDGSGNMVLSMYVHDPGVIDIDPGPATSSFNCNGLINNFILRISPSGNLISSLNHCNGQSPLGYMSNVDYCFWSWEMNRL